jgi:hypothetical protein
LGAFQPGGRAPAAPEILKPDIGIPSLDAKVTLTVWLAPTTTATAAAEAVATTKS